MLSLLLCRCEDYILIDRGDFGSTEICGNSTSANMMPLPNNFTVNFRTSDSEFVRGRGFRMLVFCAVPDDPGIMYNNLDTSKL